MADDSLEITLTNNDTIGGSLDLTTNQTNTISNTSSETIDIKPLSQTSTASQTMDLKPVKVDSSSNNSSNSRQEVVYDPIRTDQSNVLDVKPLAIDMCMRSGPASLPPTHICEPYHHRIGLTMLGVELFGLVVAGESQTIVDDRPRRPVLAWGEVTPAPPAFHVGLPTAHHHEHRHEHHHDHDRGLAIHPKRKHGGLRIRLGH
jgi:hypothetical protein